MYRARIDELEKELAMQVERLRNVEADQNEQIKQCKDMANKELQQVTKRMRDLEKRWKNEQLRADEEAAKVDVLRERLQNLTTAHKREIEAARE